VRQCAIFFLLSAIIAVFHFSEVHGQPQPGDVFKEYYHSCRDQGGCNCGGDTKRLGSGYGAVTPLYFTVDGSVDVTDVTKAEIFIEITECHEGTKGLKANLNDGDWIDVPSLPVSNFYEMAHFWFPIFPVDLADLKEGTNKLGLSVSTSGGSPTPQMLVVGTHLRVYYDPAKKACVKGTISSPAANSGIGKTQEIGVATSGGTAKKVEFIGHYKGVNWEGDGNFTQWHYAYFHHDFKWHIGTDSAGPDFNVTWNTEWVPDQQAVKLAARIHGEEGTIYMTPAVENCQICRPDMSVELGIPNPMEGWVTRNSGNVTQKFNLTGDPSNILGARIFEKSWGDYSPEILINGTSVGNLGGGGYNFYFAEKNIDAAKAKEVFKTGENSITMKSGGHHGHEAEYPGMMPVVQFSASNDCPATAARRRAMRSVAGEGFAVERHGETLSFGVSSGMPCEISIVGLDGTRIAGVKARKNGGYSLNTSAIPNGVYLLKVNNGAIEKTERISIAR
jgi:hypothetical protein